MVHSCGGRFRNWAPHSFEMLKIKKSRVPAKDGSINSVHEFQCWTPGSVLTDVIRLFRAREKPEYNNYGLVWYRLRCLHIQGLFPHGEMCRSANFNVWKALISRRLNINTLAWSRHLYGQPENCWQYLTVLDLIHRSLYTQCVCPLLALEKSNEEPTFHTSNFSFYQK